MPFYQTQVGWHNPEMIASENVNVNQAYVSSQTTTV